MSLTEKQLRAKMKRVVRSLKRYREQLLARHQEEPQKSPPLFLLNASITALERETE